MDFGYIYLVELKGYRGKESLYKIGKTTCISERIKGIEWEYSGIEKVVYTHTFHAIDNTERFLHWCFSDKRYKGTHHREIFYLDETDLLVYSLVVELIDDLEHKAIQSGRDLFLRISDTISPSEFRSAIREKLES